MKRVSRSFLVLMAFLLVTACTAAGTSSSNAVPTHGATAIPATSATVTVKPGERPKLTVMTHDSFSISEAVVAAFRAECNCTVQFLKSGDTGLALNKAILSKNAPLADVFFGIDNTFLSRALAEDLFEPYQSPALSRVPAVLRVDPQNRVSPVDVGYVSLNFDKAFFEANNLPLPKELRDLANPAYRGLLVVQNPATSSPGLAFLAATVAAFGEEGDYTYRDFWRDLKANEVLVTDGWEDAYYSQFSGGSGEGDRPLVVSYAPSPAAEVFFADPQPAESPTANLLLPGSSFRQIEFVGILKGTKQGDLARQWVDFMLGEQFQADIPLQMWVYPAVEGTPLPEVFMKHAQAPTEATTLAPEEIGAARERWIQAWTDTVLR